MGVEDEDDENETSTTNLPFIFYSDGEYPGPPPNQYHLYTVCAVAVRCAFHNQIALCRSDRWTSGVHNGGLWLPFIASREFCRWKHLGWMTSEFFAKELGIFFDRNQVMETHDPPIGLTPYEKISLRGVDRIHLPDGKFVCRLIFLAHWIGPDLQTHWQCCRDTNHIRWVSLSRLSHNSPDNDDLQKVWGSEVVAYASLKSFPGNPLNLPSYSDIGCQTSEQAGDSHVFKYVARKSHPQTEKNAFAQLLLEANYGETEVARIYNDFVQHCWPSTNMSFYSFANYADRIHLESVINTELFSLKHLFKGMNYKLKGYIAFNEFLLGMISMDPRAPHGQVRYAFLFRYYGSDGCLSVMDLVRMEKDITELGGQKMENFFKRKLSYETFVKEIDSGKITGTERLCRMSIPFIQLINESKAYEEIPYNRAFAPEISAICTKCRPKNYIQAIHSVGLTDNGRVKEPRSSEDSVSLLSLQIRTISPRNLNFLQRHSLEFVFKHQSNSNYVLDLIRRFAGYNQMTDERKNQVRADVLHRLPLDIIKTLCEEVTEVIAAEPRVLKVSTPTCVLGDIHGNINDLLIFESQLWSMAPSVLITNVLFLGDYVDRGEFSIEVVCYLFAMKTLCPSRFFLLRGNHEVRSIQKSFTFEKECLEKYVNNGMQVFEMLNKVFDILPFAAVIDESIYCAHGGIPFTQTKIEDLMRLPTSLQDPEQEAPSVWEILWSDPMTTLEFHELSEFMKKLNDDGYLSNMKRSTAFYFAEKATQNFLRENNLSYVIRAHEVVNEGFKFNHHGRVITVFSCSRYCGGPNKAAAIIIESYQHNGFIKIISLET